MKNLTPGQSILQGLKEALAYVRGEQTDCIVHKPEPKENQNENVDKD